MAATSGNIADACTAIASALGETLELRAVFQRVAAAVRGVIPFDRMGVSLLDDPQTARAFAMVGDGAGLTEMTVSQQDYSPHMWPREAGGGTIRIQDSNLELDPSYPADRRAIDLGYRAQLIEFLESQGRQVGVLWFQSHEAGRFTDAHVEMLPPLANLVTLAIEHERLASESRAAAALREREGNLEMLDELLGAVTGVLDIREVFQRVSEIARKVLPHDGMGLPIITDDREHIIPLATTGLASEFVPTIRPIPDHVRPLMTAPWDTHIVDDLATSLEGLDNPFAQGGHRSMLRVAIRLDGEMVGALAFFSRRAAAFSHPDTLIARRIADHIALVISHQRLADESRRAAALRERQANLDALDGLLTTLAGVLDVRDVFDRVADIGNTVMPHDAMTIVMRAGDPELGILHAATGAMKHVQVPQEVRIPPHLLSHAWDFVLVDELQEDARYAAAPAVRAGMRSLLAMPIWVAGEVRGAVNLYSFTARRFTRDDVPMARRITDHIALALSHQRLAEEVRHSAELRAKSANLALFDASLTALTEAGELRQVIDRISDIAQAVLPHDAMALGVLLTDGVHVRFHVAKMPADAKLPEVIETPQHLRSSDWDFDLVEDLQTDPRNRDYPAARIGYRSALRVPIRIDGQLAAGVGFFSFTAGLYKETDVPLARRVADRLAINLLRERGLDAARRADEASARVSRLESRVHALTEELNARSGFHRVIGKSPTWRHVLTMATQVAATETTVLLLGESGTGKEVVARLVHRGSARKNGPFVALNCAALPEQLLESELFGYERGAFTGAMQSRAGRIEQAAGGVLFLDEVGEMTPPVQAKFLRVLQEREFQRLGGTKVLKADIRVIAATNRNPKQAMERGAFREDLYYRLSVFEISLPPLRDRKDDILLLVDAFLAELTKSVGRPAAGLSEDARDRLLAYEWPGNVRELRNAIERAVILCEGGLITSEHLPINISRVRGVPAPAPAAAASEPAAVFPAEGIKLATVERELLHKALAKAGNNKSQAAKLLGLPRGQFYSLLKRHGLTDAKR